MFSFIKKALYKIYTGATSRLSSLFIKKTINSETLKELKIILLSADTGVTTTKKILQQLTAQHESGMLREGSSLKSSLRNILIAILDKPEPPKNDVKIFILAGINGSGKTTFAAKLAHYYTKQGKKALLVAADTFRAAAQEQLCAWATKIECNIITGKEQQDPASVVFEGCQEFIRNQYDILIVDTAGRLQTKTNLMHELAKLKRVISKQLPSHNAHVLLTIDGMLGQNSLEQVKLFKECTDVNGIVLTKMDGTGKGGIVFAIANELAIHIQYITFGEQIDQVELFDAKEYVNNLLNT